MCTNLLLSVPGSSAGSRINASARALELAGTLSSSVYLVPRSCAFPLEKAGGGTLNWTNQYGFVGIASPAKFETFPAFMDGLNETGLSAAALWLPGTLYPAAPTSGPNNSVVYTDFVAWILGNYSCAATLEADLTSGTVVRIYGPVPGQGFAPLHFIATDATGASVVVEFVNNTMNVYGPTAGANGVPAGATSDGVLTNAPFYDWQRTNLQNYETLTIVGPETSTTRTTGPVVGSGMLGMPGDPMSQSRFVRAATLRKGYDPTTHLLPSSGAGWLPAPGGGAAGFADPTQTVVTIAMQLVQMVMETPYGTTLSRRELDLKKGDVAAPFRDAPAASGSTIDAGDLSTAQPGDWTMWCVVRDHSNPAYYFQSAFSGIINSVTLTSSMFEPNSTIKFPNFLSIPILPAPGVAWCVPASFT